MPRKLLSGRHGGGGARTLKGGQEPDHTGCDQANKAKGFYHKGGRIPLQDFLLGSYGIRFVFSNWDSVGIIYAPKTSEGE